VKTAISLPDDLFEQIDQCSRQLKVSRSRLLADAAREYLARRRLPVDPTAAWNDVIDEVGQPGEDAAAIALRQRSRAALRGNRRRTW
jgi:metal-responsive CopG/Arc/MetJ family transcriptional regulator